MSQFYTYQTHWEELKLQSTFELENLTLNHKHNNSETSAENVEEEKDRSTWLGKIMSYQASFKSVEMDEFLKSFPAANLLRSRCACQRVNEPWVAAKSLKPLACKKDLILIRRSKPDHVHWFKTIVKLCLQYCNWRFLNIRKSSTLLWLWWKSVERQSRQHSTPKRGWEDSL